MTIDFVKTQSVGNDFVLVHDADIQKLLDLNSPAPLTGGVAVATKPALTVDQLLVQLAIKASERNFGIGSDGLLVLGKQGGDITLRMFNPDGTEDFCGNGLRCAAICAANEGLVTTPSFVIVHRGERIETELLGDNRVRTKLGKADYTPAKVPVISPRELFKETVWSGMIDGMPLSFFGSALTTGSTHVVIPTVSFPDDDSFASISSTIEKDEHYPQHTSVIWAKEVEPMHLKIRIWERGAGETLGCGTGSSAAAADLLRRRSKGGTVQVDNPGGTIAVTMESWDAPITAEGEATIVYRGTYQLNLGS